jgi:large subunit ribosomal protein L10
MRPEKQLLLDEIKENIEQSKALVVTQYNNLSPLMSWGLSSKLAKDNSFFQVVKKRLFIKAAKECGLVLSLDILEGNIAIAYFKDDLISPTKTIVQFGKENSNTIKVLSGRFEGQIYDAKDIEVLSKLPTLDVMRSQFLGLLEAPMTQTLSVMESMLTSIMYCLENKANENKSS